MQNKALRQRGIILCLTFLTLTMVQAELAPGYFNVQNYGAVADGVTLNTEAIKKAIDAAVEIGGGTVYFPAGEYLTGPVHLKSHITIFIDAGAILKFSRNFDDYLPMIESRWEGTVGMNFSPLFYAYQVENIAICGRGTIDGQGDEWWEFYRKLRAEKKKYGEIRTQSKWQKMHRELNRDILAPDNWNWNESNFLRPPFIQFFECKNIMIEGISIQNSPFWTINPVFCDNVTISGVTIVNPPESYNTDGINPSSCTNVHIANCHISVGDDCITLKSGRDDDGRQFGRPTENVTITNCTMLNGHGGVVIGSEMSGDIRKVTISNCVFNGTDRGIRIKSMRGRGGIVEEIRVTNIVMKNIRYEAITLNMFYQETPDEPVSDRTPRFRNIHLSDITVSQARSAGMLLGLEEMPIDNVTFSNINIEAEDGFLIKNAKNIEFHDVVINAVKGPALSGENITNLEIEGVKTCALHENVPVIELKNTQNVFVRGASPLPGTTKYLSVSGAGSKAIVLVGNNFHFVKMPVAKSSDVPADAVIIE
jgi:polygalacturonase